MVPIFAVIFLLWSVILRPQLWPNSVSDLGRPEAAVALASLIATQCLLVVVCFVLGRGIGGVVGFKPVLPFFLPATLSFLSVPLSRLVWNPRVMAENAGFDPLLHEIAVPPDDPKILAADMLAQVMALQDEVSEEVVQQHLSAIAVHVDPVLIRQTLGDAVAGRQATPAGIKALIVHATDPAVCDLLSGSAYLDQAFAAAGRDPDLLTLFARRCVIAVEDDPDLVHDCPAAGAVVRAAQQTLDPDARDSLNRLAGLLDQARAAQRARG